MKKLLIFDMDGVILDSEPLHAEAEHEILASYGISGVDLSWTVGISSYIMWGRFIEEYGITAKADELLSEQYRRIRNYVSERRIPESKGLSELIAYAKERGMKLAVASSSNSELVHPILRTLGIFDAFDTIVCGDEAANKKPEPDIYLEALRRLGVDAADAITIEDSRSGMTAANRAGIDCIGYLNPTSGNQKLDGTIALVDELIEVKQLI